jgi:hypothetical protein
MHFGSASCLVYVVYNIEDSDHLQSYYNSPKPIHKPITTAPHVWVSSTLDAALKVPALPLDGESPCCPTWSHPSDLVRNVEEGMYCDRARWKSFGLVLVVEARCMD